MMRGQYNVHKYVHILCGETHRDEYGVSNREKLTSVIGVARATHAVCVLVQCGCCRCDLTLQGCLNNLLLC